MWFAGGNLLGAAPVQEWRSTNDEHGGAAKIPLGQTRAGTLELVSCKDIASENEADLRKAPRRKLNVCSVRLLGMAMVAACWPPWRAASCTGEGLPAWWSCRRTLHSGVNLTYLRNTVQILLCLELRCCLTYPLWWHSYDCTMLYYDMAKSSPVLY